MNIRSEQPADRSAIAEVHREAFPSDLEARLVDTLRERGEAVVSLVAWNEGRIAGHVLLSTVGLVPPRLELRGLGLAPVAVRPALQSRGVGAALVRDALAQAAQDGWDYVVVLGEPAYYQRFGFRRASGFGLGNEYQVDDPFMALELRPGALAGIAGLVTYSEAFSLLA